MIRLAYMDLSQYYCANVGSTCPALTLENSIEADISWTADWKGLLICPEDFSLP
jgi:hypothetical protein